MSEWKEKFDEWLESDELAPYSLIEVLAGIAKSAFRDGWEAGREQEFEKRNTPPSDDAYMTDCECCGQSYWKIPKERKDEI